MAKPRMKRLACVVYVDVPHGTLTPENFRAEVRNVVKDIFDDVPGWYGYPNSMARKAHVSAKFPEKR